MAGIPTLQMPLDEATALLKNQIRRGNTLREYELTSQGIADLEQRL
jgi:type VI protein secretion system component Hcp